MTEFKSASLARTWPRIAFGTLAGESQAQPDAQVFPSRARQAQAGPALHRAGGREGRTIAEVYAQKAALKDLRVAVRGRVVKVVEGVMGKTWLHLRDGTGAGPSADLALTTDGTAKVGDVVVATGLVHLDRDLGSGYRYDILVEDARLQAE